jgi:hypothetical protein
VLSNLPNDDKALLPYLAAYIRRAATPDHPVQLDHTTWKELAEAERSVSVTEKVERLLQLSADRTVIAGQGVRFNPLLDAPLVNAASPEEFRYLLLYLRDSGYLGYSTEQDVTVTVKGWQRLESPEGARGVRGRCFVAMSFSDELLPAWNEAIEPAAKDCGYTPNRADSKPHSDDINFRILAEIRKAQFLIADFTEHRQGVYFEAGFARGLGKEVLWTCRRDQFLQSHFDTNHYLHTLWDKPEDLRSRLEERIRATFGDFSGSSGRSS